MNGSKQQLVNDIVVNLSLRSGYLAVNSGLGFCRGLVLSEQQHYGGQDGRRRAG